MAENQHLSFLLDQLAHIEPNAYKVKYPDIQYHLICPVDTSAWEWAKTITHFATDKTGKPEILANRSEVIPLADVTREKFEHRIEAWAIGYDYSDEEIAQAARLGIPLAADKAIACRRAVEEMCDDLLANGNADLGWDGLLDNASITKKDAAANGTGGSKKWKDKKAEDIIADVNDVLSGVYIDSKTVELADTLLFPPQLFADIMGKVIEGTAVTVWDFLERNNIYTRRTGMPLMVREYRGLETAAAGDTGRVVAYRRDPEVLKFHMPMPFQFQEPIKHMFHYVIPGRFRVGGLEIRRPKAMRYLDGVL